MSRLKKREVSLGVQEALLAEYTTLGIGGTARYLVEVHSIEELRRVFSEIQQARLPYLILGKGSNSLLQDRLFPGVAIINRIETFEHRGGLFTVGGGLSFPLLGSRSARLGYGGLEFALGIPGTVGGAVVMNAGAHGQQIADSLVSVDLLKPSGERRTYLREELHFGYRTSPFQSRSKNRKTSFEGCITKATFQLKPSDTARRTQQEIAMYRQKTQPLQARSAGCMFRNPIGYSAGALIEQCGMKGYQLGGAKISDHHANFMINVGHATAKAALCLIEHVQKKVADQADFFLEPEICIHPYPQGDFDELFSR